MNLMLSSTCRVLSLLVIYILSVFVVSLLNAFLNPARAILSNRFCHPKLECNLYLSCPMPSSTTLSIDVVMSHVSLLL